MLTHDGRVYFVKGHQRWEVRDGLNDILNCLEIRLNIGRPIDVPQDVIDSYDDSGQLVSCP
jgi:hypothetical protein